jgi:hypothetical protein
MLSYLVSTLSQICARVSRLRVLVCAGLLEQNIQQTPQRTAGEGLIAQVHVVATALWTRTRSLLLGSCILVAKVLVTHASLATLSSNANKMENVADHKAQK